MNSMSAGSKDFHICHSTYTDFNSSSAITANIETMQKNNIIIRSVPDLNTVKLVIGNKVQVVLGQINTKYRIWETGKFHKQNFKCVMFGSMENFKFRARKIL